MMDKPVSFYAFEMLYWCGIREGELLALTAADFNFEKETVAQMKGSHSKISLLIVYPIMTKISRVLRKCRGSCCEV